MKKKKNNQNRQNESNSLNQNETIVKKQETIIEKISKIINIKYLMLILAFLTLIVAAIPIWPKSEEEKTKDSINEKISKLENTFRSETIIINYNSDLGKLYVKEFQDSVLYYINLWKKVESYKSISEFRDNNSSDICGVFNSQVDVFNQFQDKGLGILKVVNKIASYGARIKIKELIPNEAQITYMEIVNDRREESYKAFGELSNEMTELVKKYNVKDLDEVPAQDLIETYEPYQKQFDCIEELKFVDDFLSFIIEQNSMYMLYIR